MRIATWNVNSVKARMPNVIEWLAEQKPDVVLLQEIKCETHAFPALEFEALGYQTCALGQKTYNGVAILSRFKIEDVREHLPGDKEDTQARYIEAMVNGIRLASIYLPNGNPIYDEQLKKPQSELEKFGEKFEYKLKWMTRLKAHMKALLLDELPVVLGGDYNVIPEAVDVFNPKGWEEDALFHPKTRAAWREMTQMGYTEAFRALNPEKISAYTFWDYQHGAWQRDAGLRIDHFLLSPEAADSLEGCFIDRTPRGKDKASDHTPVIIQVKA